MIDLKITLMNLGRNKGKEGTSRGQVLTKSKQTRT